MDENVWAAVRNDLELNPSNAARTLAAEIKRTGGQDQRAIFLYGVAKFRTKDYQGAEKAMRSALSRNPGNADVFYYLGLIAERRGLSDEARKYYRIAASLDPRMKEAQQKLQAFGEGVSEQNGPAKGPSVSGRSSLPKDSSLALPETEAEFDVYEPRIRRKALIDAQAENAAQSQVDPTEVYRKQVRGQFRAFPWLIKVVVVVLGVMILYGLIVGTFRSESARKEYERGQQEQCEFLKQQKASGPLPPWC